MKIEFDTKPVYSDGDKYIKTKIVTYTGSTISNLHDNKTLKEKALCKSLSRRKLDSVIKAKKKYYPQTGLEECKYEPKKIKMENLFDNDLEKCSSGESHNDSNNETESDDEKDNYESNK